MPSASIVPQPALNARLADQVCRHWAGRQDASAAPQPQRLVFRELLGVRRTAHGYGLNLQFVYHSQRGADYVLEGVCVGYEDGALSGLGRARSCTCPDFTKRRGSGREKLRSEARCCKHMLLMEWLISTWEGRWPWNEVADVRQDGSVVIREF